MDQKLCSFFVGILVTLNPAQAQGIRITEIMSDPEPVYGLPPAEYIEIYNSGGSPVSLSGWSVEDASGRLGIIDSAHVDAGEWRILCAARERHYFSAWNPVPVEPWPVLNNDSDVIILRDMNGRIVDSIGYKRSWHKPEFRDGGVALERNNLFGRCDQARHWGSSEDISGGTPNAVNSLFSEPVPEGVEVHVFASQYIHIWFSSELDPETFQNVQIKFVPGLTIKGVEFRKDQFVIDTAPVPDHRQEYVMEISGLITCSGTPVHLKEFHFRPSRPALPGDIRISEVMFNSGPEIRDYLELINVSGDLLDIQGLHLSYEKDGEQADTVILDTLMALAPGRFVSFTANEANLLKAFPAAKSDDILEVGNMVNFPSDRAVVSIHSREGTEIEQVYYHHTFHHEVVEDRQGVSLERRSMFNEGRNRWDWASASAAVGFGTPGNENSQLAEPGRTPVIDWGDGQVDAGGEISFRYHGLPANSVLTVRVFNLNGDLIKNVVEAYSCGSSGIYRFGLNEIHSGFGPLLAWVEVLADDGFVFRTTDIIYIHRE